MTLFSPTLPHGLLEVCDAGGSPLLLMPAASVRAQGIPHKRVQVALRDGKKRVCIVRPQASGLWSLPGDCVYAHEATEDAALRVLRTHLGLTDPPVLTLREGKTAAPDLGQATLFTSTPCAQGAAPDARHIAESLFLDKDELLGMRRHFAELLDDDLIYALDNNLI